MWPAEPVVARAYLDQLRRSDVIAADRDEALTEVLDGAENVLETDGSDALTAGQLETLAAALAREGADRAGVTRARYLALAATLEGIADRLR